VLRPGFLGNTKGSRHEVCSVTHGYVQALGIRRETMGIRPAPTGLVVVLATVLGLVASTAVADIVSDLENHYSFNDWTDPTYDDSGNARHGTNSGAVWRPDNLRDGVMEFGTSDFVQCALPNLNTAGEFTIALWANLTDPLAGNRGLFQAQSGGTTPGGTKVLGGWVAGPPQTGQTDTEGTIWGRIIDTAGAKSLAITGPPKLNTGEWTHIAYVGDGSTCQRYKNGVAEGAAVSYNGTLAAHDTIFIGRQGSESAIGRLDDFRVYSRALTTAELGDAMAATAPPESLKIDFGAASGGGPNGPYQPGWRTFEANEGGGDPDHTRTYGSALGVGDTMDVAIGGYTHSRDYAQLTGGPFLDMNSLLSDNALRNAAGTATLTLADLEPGVYEMTVYHHDTVHGGGSRRHDILVTDANVTGATVYASVPTTGGTAPTAVTTRTFQFVADGSPVAIDFVADAGGGHTALNGFELERALPKLRVDFGQAATTGPNGPTQDGGFFGFEANEGSGNPDVTKTFISPVGANGTVDVTIGGYTHFRDYDPISSGPFVDMSDLLSDMVLRYSDGTMTLTLDDLAPGPYEITTYHHSTQFGGGTIDIALRRGSDPADLLFDDLPVSGTTGPTSISTATFRFQADGSPVYIDFLGGSGLQHNSLNGFELALLPEPTTLSLLGLGALLAARRRRRRR